MIRKTAFGHPSVQFVAFIDREYSTNVRPGQHAAFQGTRQRDQPGIGRKIGDEAKTRGFKLKLSCLIREAVELYDPIKSIVEDILR